MDRPPTRSPYGAWLLLVAALIGLAIAIFNYVAPGNGIHGTAGALLVVISTLLMVLAAGALALWTLPGWLRGTLLTLILLDILGTGFAAYMLEAWWLIAAMALALFGWLVRIAADPVPRRVPAPV